MPERAMRATAWTKVAFGDVVRQVKDRVDPEQSGLERYVAGEHMDTDDLRLRRWGDIGDGYLGPAFHMRFKPGHVLYGSRRTYLRKVAVADFEGITANTTYVLEPKDPNVLLPELLPFIMQTEAFNQHSVRESKGSVNPYVNFSDLARYQFALPPIEGQRRLNAMLRASEAAGARLDALCASLEILLRSAVDSAAHAGIEARSLARLETLVEADRPICYGILMPGTGYEGGVPVVKVKDFPDGFIQENGLLLTDPRIDEEYRRSRLRPGDLLISIRGTIGRLACVPDSLSGANITQDTARLSIRREINFEFVRAMIESSFVQRQIATYTTGLAVKGINIGELRDIDIPMVSRDRQDALARGIQIIRARLQDTAERLRASRELKRRLVEMALGRGV
jgi:type I restriction enzyme S subunit